MKCENCDRIAAATRAACAEQVETVRHRYAAEPLAATADANHAVDQALIALYVEMSSPPASAEESKR